VQLLHTVAGVPACDIVTVTQLCRNKRVSQLLDRGKGRRILSMRCALLWFDDR